MKLIYTLILLLFSSSVFADFIFVDNSLSDFLDYGFHIQQIDTVRIDAYVYHLQVDDDVAICYIYDGDTTCMLDTQYKSLIFILKEHSLKNN